MSGFPKDILRIPSGFLSDPLKIAFELLRISQGFQGFLVISLFLRRPSEVLWSSYLQLLRRHGECHPPPLRGSGCGHHHHLIRFGDGHTKRIPISTVLTRSGRGHLHFEFELVRIAAYTFLGRDGDYHLSIP